jgi:hypothetical protein
MIIECLIIIFIIRFYKVIFIDLNNVNNILEMFIHYTIRFRFTLTYNDLTLKVFDN